MKQLLNIGISLRLDSRTLGNLNLNVDSITKQRCSSTSSVLLISIIKKRKTLLTVCDETFKIAKQNHSLQQFCKTTKNSYLQTRQSEFESLLSQ